MIHGGKCALHRGQVEDVDEAIGDLGVAEHSLEERVERGGIERGGHVVVGSSMM